MEFIYKNTKVPLPNVRQFYILKYASPYNPLILETVKGLTDKIETFSELSEFISSYILWLETEREKNPDWITPYAPPEESHKHYFNCNTADIKQVADYTLLSFNEIYRLDVFTFWGYLHDCVVWRCEQTEKGREYLEKAYYNSQTEPDREALKNKIR